ncbi:MAG: diacylglycerol kinase family protein [Patescibacteria group bacterium]
MEEKEQKKWREAKAHKRLLNAFRGLYVFVAREEHWFLPASIFLLILVIIGSGIYFRISEFEWISLVIVIGFLIVTEVFNTAIEIDIDLTSPEYHPYARDTKDVAAGAVAFAGIVALIVVFIIFLPKILSLL